jgi:hypothetical protein
MVTASIGVALRKAVTDGLAEHFAADSDFNGTVAAERETVVSFGYDFSNPHREHVFTGRSRADTPAAGMRSDRNTRNETEERAEAIGGALEDWFADRKSNELGVDGLNSLVVASWVADYAQIDGGTAALRTYTVRWTARLE